jgi:DNA modification methylase
VTHLLVQGDARRIPLADGCVHTCITSPPYWGLRDYGVDGQIGLESSPDAFVASMVAVFREVRRVLRDDGTLWLNLGDTYAANAANQAPQTKRHVGSGFCGPNRGQQGIAAKNLIGIPWRVAFALQADGWYLRSDIIWHKPNPMPESVTDRPTKAHEYLFLLAKSERYFYDAEAIRESMAEGSAERYAYAFGGAKSEALAEANKDGIGVRTRPIGDREPGAGRNKRSVWTVTTVPFKGAHFAVFPPKLIEPCVKAGTSERGCCPECGAPWERITESERIPTRPGNRSKVYAAEAMVLHPDSPYQSHHGDICGNRDPKRHTTATKTVGWQPSCSCPPHDPVPCLVFDPFNGSGTTGVVATGLGRSYVGTDLNRAYLDMADRRISRPHAPIASAAAEAPLPLFQGGAS